MYFPLFLSFLLMIFVESLVLFSSKPLSYLSLFPSLLIIFNLVVFPKSFLTSHGKIYLRVKHFHSDYFLLFLILREDY